MIGFAVAGASSRAAHCRERSGPTERGRRHFPARWFVFKGLRDDFPPPRRAARVSIASRCRPIKGLSKLLP
jgi:hypothetical protein